MRPPSLRTVSISTPAWIAHPNASASGPSGLSRDARRPTLPADPAACERQRGADLERLESRSLPQICQGEQRQADHHEMGARDPSPHRPRGPKRGRQLCREHHHADRREQSELLQPTRRWGTQAGGIEAGVEDLAAPDVRRPDDDDDEQQRDGWHDETAPRHPCHQGEKRRRRRQADAEREVPGVGHPGQPDAGAEHDREESRVTAPSIQQRAVPGDAQRADGEQDGDAHHVRVHVSEQQRPRRELGDRHRVGDDATERPPIDSTLSEVAGQPLPHRFHDRTVADEQHEDCGQHTGRDAGALGARMPAPTGAGRIDHPGSRVRTPPRPRCWRRRRWRRS